jgi:putative hemolysin
MDESAFTYCDPADPFWRRLAIGGVERLTGRETIKRLYLAHRRAGWGAQGDFFAAALAALSIDLRFDPRAFAAIPRKGPLVVAANHPFGVLDGIAACALIGQARPDFRVLTNAVLLRAPEMRARMLPVEMSETAQGKRANARTLAQALAHAQAGGCVVIFPAGAISTSPDRLGRAPAVDGPWSAFAGRLATKARAQTVPLRFMGQNSRLFQIVSHVHPALRLALFFHEMRRRIGAPIEARIGAPIPPQALEGLEAQAATALMRAACDALAREENAGDQPRPR